MAMAEVWDVQQLKLTWEKCRNAPRVMWRGAAVAHGSVGYFNSDIVMMCLHTTQRRMTGAKCLSVLRETLDWQSSATS